MTARWRPKSRRQILQLNDEEGSQSPTTTTPADSSAPTNKLHALLGHYNSDDDDSDSAHNSEPNNPAEPREPPINQSISTNPGSVWQELWDPGSGHPYYWNPITNDLTWEKPRDFYHPQQIPATDEKNHPERKRESGNIFENPLMYPTIAPVVEEPPPVPTDFKVSFKLSNGEKTKKEEPTKKTVVSLDVDLIIAEIEKEIPPDYKEKNEPFVPLFKRRKMENGTNKPSLNFKNYFPINRTESILPFIEEPGTEESLNPLIVNTHRGFGFHESEESKQSEPKEDKINFVKGETLVPMTVVAPEPPPTVEDKIQSLQKRLAPDSTEWIVLNAFSEPWRLKKLDQDYFESWLDRTSEQLNQNATDKEPDVDQPTDKSESQVIDMVLDDSASESVDSNPSKAADGLDSALDSFYSDLAALDADPVGQSQDSGGDDPPEAQPEPDGSKRTIKRSKMSQDMSSLVAKWQKINQSGKS